MLADDNPKHVVFLGNIVRKFKERCVKTDLYFILNYLYTHGDGENKKLLIKFRYPRTLLFTTNPNIRQLLTVS
jgi:hypothetical protein